MKTKLCKAILLIAMAVPAVPMYAPASDQEPPDSSSASVQELLRTANLWLQEGNLEAAERYYRQVLKLEKEAIPAWRGLGRIYARRKNWEEAANWFSKIEKRLPHDVEAHYYLGIQRRESGKFKGLLLRQLDFRASEKHFRRVIDGDSLYSDVWLQLALLERYREHYRKAVDLALKQIHLKPQLVDPRVQIFRLIDLYVEYNDSATVLTEMASPRYGWYGDFARAEKLRRLGHLDTARAEFEKLLVPGREGSATAVYLRLARIAFEQGMSDLGQELYWRAIQAIENSVDAEIAFNDIKFILTDQEYERWLRCVLVSQKKLFFQQLWASRDPFPGAPDNPRLVEHYKRLLFAEKWYRQDEPHRPYNEIDLQWGGLPRVFGLNEEFHQKGLVYIRWGEPDDKSLFTEQNYPTYESWLYRRTTNQPQIIVHFANADDASPSDWRIARIPPPEVVWDMGLETWDPRYHTYIMANSEVEQLSLAEELERDLRDASKHLLTEERMIFPDTIEVLPAHFYWAAYKGRNGSVDLNFYYGVAFRDAFAKKDPVGLRRFFESGVAIFDTTWTQLTSRLRRFALTKHAKDKGAIAADAQTFELPPGVYHLTFFVRDETHKRLGSWRFLDTLETFRGPSLSLSDPTLAVDLGPQLELKPGRFRRGDIVIAPNPSRAFLRQQPVFVYLEAYGVQLDENGVGHCRVTYTLRPKGKRRTGLLGLFRKPQGSVSVTNEFDPTTRDTPIYTALDVSNFGVGDVELEVDVTDLLSGKSARKSILLHIIKG